MADYVVVSRPPVQAAAANYDSGMGAMPRQLLPPDLQQQQQPHHSVVVVPDHRPPPVSQRTRGPRTTSTSTSTPPQRRRQALEQEVAELKQQLSNEQTVHQILERALQQPQQQQPMSSVQVLGSTIPAFVPAKAKELLAELVLVEEEIARLESLIHTMKADQQARQQRTTSCCMTMQQHTDTVPVPLPPVVSSSPHHLKVPISSRNTTSTATTTTTTTERESSSNSNNNNAETIKSMFFISQAMAMDGGEYLSSKVKSPRRPVAHAAAGGSMMPSPKNSISDSSVFAAGLPPPRHSLEKQQHQHQHHPSPPDVALLVDANNINNRPPTNTTSSSKKKTLHQHHHHHELPLISTNTTTNNKANIVPQQQHQHQHQQPNKLSERIVKCLVCIFIRLLRSSRAAEMAADSKSSAAGAGISSLHQQQHQGMGSFRMDTALSCLSSSSGSGSGSGNTKQQRGGGQGQQDHYGIFGIPDAIVRDIGPYKNLVRFTSTSLDLSRGFSTSPLLTKLRHMLEALQQVDLRHLITHNQKLAFWINVYNTCIMNGILQHGVPSNPDKLLALKNKATINVSGQQFNALVIENFILRQPSSVKEEFWRCDVDVDEQAVREVYGLKTSEPNILFALCCGIRSSPALRIYKADRVAMELDKAKLEYLQASLVVTTTRRLMIPSLISCSMHDFAKDTESLVRWICEQLPTSWSLRKSMVECLLNLRGSKLLLEEVVHVIPFDYDFQYLLPMM